ncbi:methylated-DNA--protein-cysteine methyltransferase [Sinomonas cellulolyticus]|uniref:Methylated-DNA--protein-cysteine methyltransferase n=1 Tax=Sinomonas cellulolyticus TaxID=2801916 RepID=A0ABS1K2I2_9MICC|nr:MULTISPECIES: methylated-DNA--[protein]-cysteine S-methyltransferase [Sinomonas]MBL0705885.1 methylated-DNA--[protein]-cysteine S-methyltransferase [Sinomonas cellulolyticus]GHG42497.1 methylated-DNA--protein-cysteine methyltransferase [Sinomonas sp. KCTC 49339]
MTSTDQTASAPGIGPVDLAFPPHLAVIEPGVLEGLRRSLAAKANREGLLDVAYCVVDSPVGRLLIAATERGLVRVAFEREGHEAVLQSLAQKLSPRILEAPARLGSAAREIEEYFGGKRTSFDLPLDLSLSAGFRRTVLAHLGRIPFGGTESYTEVARAVGNPRAVRAVGTACATNPLPVVVPCHRVLRSDGSLGGYIGGLEAKNALLVLEGSA